MDEYKSVQKYLNKTKKHKSKKTSFLSNILSHILLSGILLLACLCVMKVNPSFKTWINKEVYHTNFSFAKINQTYEKYFGSIFPLSNLFSNETQTVFDEKLVYEKKESYKEGVKLTVSNNYLVPVLESGIVVFMGDKDNYGKTVIIQQVDGIDLWYVGVDTNNLKIYDYVEKGSLLGETTSNEMYLFYEKAGEFLDYQEYLG
jgi:stage IV sporulation protein FA